MLVTPLFCRIKKKTSGGFEMHNLSKAYGDLNNQDLFNYNENFYRL